MLVRTYSCHLTCARWACDPLTGASTGCLQLALDPDLDVIPAVADMLSYTESLRTFASMSPRVQRRYRDTQIVGKLSRRKQSIAHV